jgi:hypothetical protein
MIFLFELIRTLEREIEKMAKAAAKRKSPVKAKAIKKAAAKKPAAKKTAARRKKAA